jgi:tetratricopeptide (TPR) repeat protein
LWSGRYDVELLRDFGKVFLEAGQANEAISIYRYALELEEDAQTLVQLGIAYQMRDRSGDRQRAIRAFERALELRPGWDMVAQHLDGLQRSSPSAQGPR